MNKFLFLILYVISLAAIVYFYKYYLKSIVSKLIAIFTVVISSAVLYQQFFISKERMDTLFNSDAFLGRATGILLYLLFLLASLGIIFAGIKSIIEKESISLARPGAPHIKVRGTRAIIEGVGYIIIGGIFLCGVIQVGKILFF